MDFVNTNSECHNYTFAIVGAGPTGIAAAAELEKLLKREFSAESKQPLIVVLDKELKLGHGTAFRQNNILAKDKEIRVSLGPQVASFNYSNDGVREVLGNVEQILKPKNVMHHVDDGLMSSGMLSRTSERPQGWNRVLGQWEHYVLTNGGIEPLLQSMIDHSTLVSFKMESLVEKIAVNEQNTWQILLDNGDSVSAEYLIIALPAPDLLKIMKQSALVLPNTVVEAVQRCRDRYNHRLSCGLLIYSKSKLGCVLLEKFTEAFCSNTAGSHAGRTLFGREQSMVRELDTSGVLGGKVSLISLADGYEEINSFSGEKTLLFAIVFHLQQDDLRTEPTKSDQIPEVLNTIIEWLSIWLKLAPIDVLAGVDQKYGNPNVQVEQFYQSAVQHLSPLSPLRERGCIIANEESFLPPIVFAGDWAAGTGTISGAIQSGQAAAKYTFQSRL